MEIVWHRCDTYAAAKDEKGVIYLHEWDDKPFYWGKAHNSFFGGNRRWMGDRWASARYNSGYRHWIEGCLRHGAKLFIGRLCDEGRARIDEVESHLIRTYGHVMNTKVAKAGSRLTITHRGDLPACLRAGSSAQLGMC